VGIGLNQRPLPAHSEMQMSRRANLHRFGANRSSSACRLSLEQRAVEAVRDGQTAAEPTLDEVLHDPVIRLMMKCDNVTEDQLLHFIAIARHASERMN
jgi:hypothetical protein